MKAIPAVITQTTGFHLKTLAPSSIETGSKLKNAKKLFIVNPNPQIKASIGENDKTWINRKNMQANAILVKGPAMEIFPFSSVVIPCP